MSFETQEVTVTEDVGTVKIYIVKDNNQKVAYNFTLQLEDLTPAPINTPGTFHSTSGYVVVPVSSRACTDICICNCFVKLARQPLQGPVSLIDCLPHTSIDTYYSVEQLAIPFPADVQRVPLLITVTNFNVSMENRTLNFLISLRTDYALGQPNLVRVNIISNKCKFTHEHTGMCKHD